MHIGCVPDQAHWDWIFSRKGKYKRDDIYNVRLGDRPGAVKKSNVKVRSPKFVVMYDQADPQHPQAPIYLTSQEVLKYIS